MNNRAASLMKFGIVGLLNTAVDFTVFALLTAGGVPVLPAQWISYACGTLNSYLWNRNWTFRDKNGRVRRQLIRFVLVNLAALTVATALLKWLSGQTGISLPVCKLMATAAGGFINYAGSRNWVFGSKVKTGSEPL